MLVKNAIVKLKKSKLCQIAIIKREKTAQSAFKY